MSKKSHENQAASYQGIPDAVVLAIRALLQSVPHVDDERLGLVFRILEADRGNDIIRKLRVLEELENRDTPSAMEEDDVCLSQRELCEELGVDRATIWRRFKENPGLKKKLMAGYTGGGHPKCSLGKVRKFKAGLLN